MIPGTVQTHLILGDYKSVRVWRLIGFRVENDLGIFIFPVLS